MAAIRWAVAPASTDDRSIEDLGAAIVTLDRKMRADSYQMLVLVRDFDDRFGWAKWSYASCAEWLAYTCGLSLSAAREKVRTAHALRMLPAISEAFALGRLSYSKVRALTRVAQEHDEDLLLAYALDASQAQVEQRCAQIRNVAPESVDVARRAWERRSLSISRNVARNTVLISVEVPAEEGELVALALDRAVAAGEVASGIEFGADREKASASWCAQQADALVAISRAYLAGGEPSAGSNEPSAGANTADHCQVVVHVDASALHGGAGCSDLPLETIRRLTCDCSLVAVVEDEHGNPLDVGRKQRNVTTPLRRALWARDRGCTFPGCHRKRYVDGHHIKHWADNGKTNPDNITLLCTLHHRLLHEGGFSVRKDRDGLLHFARPDGREIPRGGYRVEDMVDEPMVPAAASEDASMDGFRDHPSMEGFASVDDSSRASMEVREPRAVYRLAS